MVVTPVWAPDFIYWGRNKQILLLREGFGGLVFGSGFSLGNSDSVDESNLFLTIGLFCISFLALPSDSDLSESDSDSESESCSLE